MFIIVEELLATQASQQYRDGSLTVNATVVVLSKSKARAAC